jgi:hypothetical protein
LKSKQLNIGNIILFALFTLLAIQVPTAVADCADFMVPGEYPDEIITRKGTTLTFSYEFGDRETYSYSWAKGSTSGGPIGPNSLQPGCKIPSISHESDEFLLLEKGCGSFCWYFVVLGLTPTGDSTTATHEIIYLPLAFDADRNLVAYYLQPDTISIKNLLTGYKQIFATEYNCESGSGLCFSNVTFTSESLEYRWESPTGIGPGELLSKQFDESLLSTE